MKGLCVREGRARDLAGVVALEQAMAEAPHWAEAEYRAVVADSGDYVRRRLFVAEAGGVLIGFAVGKIVGELAELESVAVDLRARRGGVGTALCEAVIGWSRDQGATAIDLEVRAASEGAIGLYRVLGFVVVGFRRAYYSGPQDDAVLMNLDLTGGAKVALPSPEKLW